VAVARRRLGILPILLGIACAGAPGGGNAAAQEGPPGMVRRLVVRVVDGDTVVLEGKERIRLAGVNAPEIDEELGLASREFTLAFANRKDAWVSEAKKDGYGRLVSDVIVDGKSLAVSLAEAGLGHVFLFPPEDEVSGKALLEAQERARAARRGIWATERFQGPLHITSFHANPIGNDAEELNAEYVRIANLRAVPLSLKGFILSNEHGDRYVFGDVTLPPGQSITLAPGAGDDQVTPGRQMQLFWNKTYPMWSNKGDVATLMDPAGNVVDRAVYDPKHRKVYPK
jgi:endonuclease YncB( thermonuclease family)